MQVTYKLGVDAGNISVIDYDYVLFKKGVFGDTAIKMCRQLTVEPGTYKITVDIHESWAGPIQTTYM